MSRAYRNSSSQGSLEAALAPTIAAQFGVFSLQQAIAAGASKHVAARRVAAGRWERLHLGVYRLAGSPASWRASMMAGWLACGERAVVSFRSAGALWGLVAAPGAQPFEVSVPRGMRRTPEGVIVHEATTLAPDDIATLGPFALTSVVRTLADLASVLPSSMLEESLDEALRRGLVSVRRLRARMEDLPWRPGIGALRGVVEDRVDGEATAESRFETRLDRLLRQAGLRPVRQHPVYDEHGVFVARLDFAFPDVMLAVEAEGRRYHAGRARWLRDLDRRNRLTALGWRIHHVTWDRMTSDPDGTIDEIRTLLAGARS